MLKHISLLVLSLCLGTQRTRAQAAELQQLTLDLQKLAQLKSMLQDMYDYYGVLSSGYDNIKGVAKGEFQLHQKHLAGLLQVNPTVQTDPKVQVILDDETQLMQAWTMARRLFGSNPYLSPGEWTALSTWYKEKLAEGSNDLEDLTMVLTDGTLRMSDDERLSVILRVHRQMQARLALTRNMNATLQVELRRRARLAADLSTFQKLSGQ